jgi:hypothetical protein
VTGQVPDVQAQNGLPLQSFTGMSGVATTLSQPGTGYAIMIGIANASLTEFQGCGLAAGSSTYAGVGGISVEVIETSPIQTGTAYEFTVPDAGGNQVGEPEAVYGANSATCQSGVFRGIASGGSITFTTISSSTVAGTLTIDWGGTGGTVTGSFTLPVCSSTADYDAGSGCLQP